MDEQMLQMLRGLIGPEGVGTWEIQWGVDMVGGPNDLRDLRSELRHTLAVPYRLTCGFDDPDIAYVLACAMCNDLVSTRASQRRIVENPGKVTTLVVGQLREAFNAHGCAHLRVAEKVRAAGVRRDDAAAFALAQAEAWMDVVVDLRKK